MKISTSFIRHQEKFQVTGFPVTANHKKVTLEDLNFFVKITKRIMIQNGTHKKVTRFYPEFATNFPEKKMNVL
jgi:hypothetical protein